MSSTITLPDGFQYVGASLLSTVFVLLGQNVLVGRYRKRAGVQYPQMYAEKAQMDASKDAHLFNCAQRAHQNTLENIPILYTLTLLSGVKYPIFAACATAAWSVSRISYTRGYITGDPKKRVTPLYMLGAISSIGLLATSTYIVSGWLWDAFSAKFL
ncbi:hypothetical protein M413DRAFT_113166 [Hebeloma cylindrosporum]|uniref:Membrane-associated proteins in eicosanoid and glutathione metabolism n=1 Tax=Hebeloma cylindrosporum TaxID=76867 RepID=A0A0C2YIR5_HEBCY|nr:hypothetical protein M413DRAFT_113166 [Hebeloma cylindrosporum h7]